MDELKKILDEIRKRPNMYLGKVSLERLLSKRNTIFK